jgi:ATP citrate (pro-S)-lyase
MSAKPIREFDGKHLLSYWLPKVSDVVTLSLSAPAKMASVSFDLSLSPQAFKSHVQSSLNALVSTHPWVLSEKLFCNPDQLIKRRGKNFLLGINLDWEGVKQWITQKAGASIKVLYLLIHP